MTTVLYGATGYTGRLVTTELARAGRDFVLAGRNGEKLAALSEELGEGAPWRVAASDDRPALRRLLADADVVINCAGPFTLAGDAVVASAVDTSTHYLDSTGEQSYIDMVFRRHGSAAEQREAALVPAMGFDFAPGDCLARVVARAHEPVAGLVLAYAVEGFGMSRGTMRSALEMMKGGHLVYRDGDWTPAPAGVQRLSFDFPAPIGHQAMSPYPAGEIVTVPRHTRVRNVTAMLTTSTAAPHPALASVLPFTLPALALTLRTPLRGWLNRAIAHLPEGPEEAERRAARFTIAVTATGEDGSVGSGILHGEDIYGLTARMLTWAAERMADSGYDASGALGPAAAFDPEALLKEHNLRAEWDRSATVPS